MTLQGCSDLSHSLAFLRGAARWKAILPSITLYRQIPLVRTVRWVNTHCELKMDEQDFQAAKIFDDRIQTS